MLASALSDNNMLVSALPDVNTSYLVITYLAFALTGDKMSVIYPVVTC